MGLAPGAPSHRGGQEGVGTQEGRALTMAGLAREGGGELGSSAPRGHPEQRSPVCVGWSQPPRPASEFSTRCVDSSEVGLEGAVRQD